MNLKDFKTSREIGKEFFESIPNDKQPIWGLSLLQEINHYIDNVPQQVLDLITIIKNQKDWPKAHNQFTEIRVFSLKNEFYPKNYLHFAEKVAKITYNASKSPAPFDKDSGWYIPSLARKTTLEIDNEELSTKVLRILTSKVQ